MNTDLTAAFPLLANLEPECARTFERAMRKVEVPAGTVMFQDGSACNSYVLVQEGAVRVQKVAENGREIVLYRVERGQSCILTTNCLMGGNDYAAEGIAETDVTLLVLPVSVFRSLLACSDSFRSFVFSAYTTRIAELMMLIEEVAFGRMDVRLATWLRQRASATEGIRITHQEIANELGTAREVVSRQLKEFERRGWIRLHRGRIEPQDLQALADLSQSR